MREIHIDENFFAAPKSIVLGNSGEVASRKIKFIQPTVDGATYYIVRFSVPATGSVFEKQITGGILTVPAIVLRVMGQGYMQWVARDVNGQLIAKSDLIEYSVLRSLSDETAPVPVVEDTESALVKIQEAASHAVQGIQILDGFGTVEEVINARKSRKTTGTYSSLNERLNADFDECITDGQLYVVLGNEIRKAREEWTAAIEEALGTVESGLSEVVDLPESTEVTE